MSENKKLSAKSERKQQRKKLLANYKPSAEQLHKADDLFNRLVVGENEYYDVLSTEDALLPDQKKS